MAPVPPKKATGAKPSQKTGAPAKAASKASASTPAPSRDFPFEDEFPTTKRDKRVIRHSTFVSKIEKSRDKKTKRRRPSKKLVTDLDALADALPDVEGGDYSSALRTQKGGSASSRMLMNQMGGFMRQKSLKHKPKAMKRKAKLDTHERERFTRNLAQMATALNKTNSNNNTTNQSHSTAMETDDTNHSSHQPVPSAGATTTSQPTTERWSALRNFISQSMTPASAPAPGVSS